MPSFTEEFIERLRAERVSVTSLPKDELLYSDSLRTLLSVLADDLEEEERRLSLAILQVKESRQNIRCLKRKRQKAFEKLQGEK
jgi:hypothetical protein